MLVSIYLWQGIRNNIKIKDGVERIVNGFLTEQGPLLTSAIIAVVQAWDFCLLVSAGFRFGDLFGRYMIVSHCVCLFIKYFVYPLP